MYSELIELVEPIEGLVGGSTRFYCRLHAGGESSVNIVILRDSGVIVPVGTNHQFQLGSRNSTHREFIMTNIRESDDGRTFTCSISELNSYPVSFRVLYRKYSKTMGLS
jgi:hypothetical protein